MAGHHKVTHVEDPGGVGLPKPLFIASIVITIIGALAVLNSFVSADTRLNGFLALLHAYFFVFVLSLGGIFFTAVQYCASARWSIAVRRIAEGFGIFLPVSFAIFLILAIGGYGVLYDLDSTYREAIGKGGIYFTNGGNDVITKGAFLSQPAIIIKGVLFYGIWGFFAWKIRSNSIKQDSASDKSDTTFYKKNVKLSIIFLILFMYTFSVHCIDMLMALEAKWFSTMFGVYIFAGMFLSSMCLIAILAIMLRKHEKVRAAIGKRQLYDLGTWIMAFSVFMCYVGFSQYMLIWYANIPEETFYIIERSNNGWQVVFALLPILKWLVPFAFLMPQPFRSAPGILIPVAIAVLVGNWLDLYWVIYPTFYSSLAEAPLGVAEIGSLCFVLGLFGIALNHVYKKFSVLPIGDPYLNTSVDGSYL